VRLLVIIVLRFELEMLLVLMREIQSRARSTERRQLGRWKRWKNALFVRGSSTDTVRTRSMIGLIVWIEKSKWRSGTIRCTKTAGST
jgi:hypothetical protein